jgi:hypothetical protein
MKHLPLITFAFIILSCSSTTDNASTFDSTTRQFKDSAQLTVNNQQADNDCVFDTSTFKFTTEAIKNYNPNLRYIWDDETEEATVWINQNDTLNLHIGGCDHFAYSATYSTDEAVFDTDTTILSKIIWLAKSFFNNGFDQGIIERIDKKQFRIERDGEIKNLIFIESDTARADHIYEPINIAKVGGRTKISMLAYQN